MQQIDVDDMEPLTADTLRNEDLLVGYCPSYGAKMDLEVQHDIR